MQWIIMVGIGLICLGLGQLVSPWFGASPAEFLLAMILSMSICSYIDFQEYLKEIKKTLWRKEERRENEASSAQQHPKLR